MKTFIYSGLLLLSFAVHSQDRFAELDKEKYMQGDTLTLTCNLTDYKRDSVHFATLYLLVEEMNSGKKWTYRYPLVDGRLEADLIIDTLVPTGKYAVTFITRKRFFDIQGKVQQKKEQKLNYSILTKNEETHTGSVTTDKNGSFKIESVLFQDTSYFIFAADNRQELKIKMITMLDSVSFNIDRQQTKFITVGNTQPVLENERTHYKAAVGTFLGKTSLPDVLVKTNKKRKVDLFNEEYSKGLFKTGQIMIFDGIEDPRIGESVNIFEFLKSKVPGLIITNKPIVSIKLGESPYSLVWRGYPVVVFLNESPLVDFNGINPKDVAMIKIFQPPSYLAPGPGGAIAIYIKKGGENIENNSQNRFRVFGYTPAEHTWK